MCCCSSGNSTNDCDVTAACCQTSCPVQKIVHLVHAPALGHGPKCPQVVHFVPTEAAAQIFFVRLACDTVLEVLL